MNILITGGLGKVGISTADELIARGHSIYILDLKNKKNRKRARMVKSSVKKIYYGTILDGETVSSALNECDCIIHMAAVTPPVSEEYPELCSSVNIEGTGILIESIKMAGRDIPVVYISAASVMGPADQKNLPINVKDNPNPVTNYDRTKLLAEELISNSGIRHCVLRLARVLDSGAEYDDDMLKMLFELPLDGRNEVILDSDAAIAVSSAAEILVKKSILDNKIFFIGGGADNGCRLTNRQLLEKLFDAMGVGMLSEDCFTVDFSKYSMNWYETEEGNRLLDYQNRTFDDYINLIWRRTQSGGKFVKYMAPRLKQSMENQSPHIKTNEE